MSGARGPLALRRWAAHVVGEVGLRSQRAPGSIVPIATVPAAAVVPAAAGITFAVATAAVCATHPGSRDTDRAAVATCAAHSGSALATVSAAAFAAHVGRAAASASAAASTTHAPTSRAPAAASGIAVNASTVAANPTLAGFSHSLYVPDELAQCALVWAGCRLSILVRMLSDST